MSLQKFKELVLSGDLRCPECSRPIQGFEKFVETTLSVWDGAGDSNLETGGSKVTLICANEGCSWKERTEYWRSYLVS